MERILAKVTISGARRGCGWRYTWYSKAKNGGWQFVEAATAGMYPNKSNYAFSKDFEAAMIAQGVRISNGRPVSNF
jgi:hypothetical protein